MEIKKVSLIGLGALGILFGNQLSKYIGDNLSIIADDQRIRRYKEEGIFCNGERCDFNYITPDAPCQPADLVMIAVKYNGLDDAVTAIKNHVGAETIILSILNGISSEEIIGRTYGMEKVLLCVSQGMDAVKVGNALTYHNKGFLFFGDIEPGSCSEKVKTVDRFFTDAGIAHVIPEDMRKHQWSKFMFNAGVNETTAAYFCDYSGVQQGGPYRDMMVAAMKEVALLAEKEHIIFTDDDINYWLNILDSLNPDGKTSMQQDTEARRASEIEMLGGTVLQLAEKHGMELPVNRMLYEKITALERTY